MKVGFISLGCSKNLIDTEVAIGHFKNNNYEIATPDSNAGTTRAIIFASIGTPFIYAKITPIAI